MKEANKTEDITEEREPTSVVPPKEVKPPTKEQVIDTLLRYIDSISLNLHETQHLNHGLAKHTPTTLSFASTLLSVSELTADFIESTGNLSASQAQNLKSCVELNRQIGIIINNSSESVADNRFLCYIIGYMIKQLKTFNEQQKE